MARDKSSIAEIASIAASVDAGNIARAAAAHALGDLDAEEQVPTLLELAQESDSQPRRMAILALARMATSHTGRPGWTREAVSVMADAVFAGDGEGPRGQTAGRAVAHAAVVGLAIIAAGADNPRPSARARETIPVPDGAVDVDALLDDLVPREVPEADRAAALVRFSEPIQAAAVASLRTSGERARAVLDALGAGEGELAPFVGRGSTGAAGEKARAIARALEPSIVPLARHPDPTIRARAIVLVARSSSDEAVEAVVAGLEDSSDAVQRVALAAVGTALGDGGSARASPRSVATVGRILSMHESWAMRVLAAEAMGRLGAAAGGAEASRRLSDAATKDAYALVRQAALESLAAFDAQGARALASTMAASDPEPRVRDAAKAIVQGVKPRSE